MHLLNIQDKDMLELAAGIGRFTGILAQKAKSLTVVELIENFIKANQKTNGVEWQLKCIYLLCMYYDLISSLFLRAHEEH